MIGVMDQAAGVAMPGGPGDRLVQRDQRQCPGLLADGDRPVDDPSGVRMRRRRNATYAVSATCSRPGASALKRRRARSSRPPLLLAGRVAAGIRPRRTPRTPRERIAAGTWSRPIPLQPRRLSWACIFR